ncbi:MAG TPA: glycosyltransferase family 2 protein [Solirubrobacteraceae bacterium]|nr:glycosyltransferase family 2 protein [Solirubrobacteraceae bacterium]
MSLPSLSIVLPCFNEEANVAEAVRNAVAAATACSERYEIIVVDDGSSDGTVRVVGGLAASEPRLRLIVHPHNRGYGDALRSGIRAARMEWVLLADADLQFDLRDLADFVPLSGSADALWGRRILRRDTLLRRAYASAWNRLVRALFALPVRDVDCGFKLIRTSMLRRFELQTTGAMISTELAVQCLAQGARIVEIGVHHRPRIAGHETGGDPRVIARAIGELMRMHKMLRRISHGAPVTP